MNIALVIAGGSGERMHQDIPKQFLNVYDKPIIVYTLEAFQKNKDIDIIAVVCISGWENLLSAYAKQFNIEKLKHIVVGGECGQDSIFNGLKELKKNYNDDDIVLIHDAIRPLISQEIISSCIKCTEKHGSAITVIPCAEAMAETIDQASSKKIIPRENLKRTQTPQGFFLGKIFQAHIEAQRKGINNSVASVTLMIELGHTVYFTNGSEKNIKLTTPEDLEIFKALLKSTKSMWIK